MNKNFKLIHFFTLLIVKHFYLFVPGVLFLVLGNKISTLIIVGLILIIADVFLSLVGCVKLENTLNNLEEEDLKNAFSSDDWRNEVIDVIQKRCDEQLKLLEDEERNYSMMYRGLQDNLKEEMNFQEIVSLFKEVCCGVKTNEDIFYAILKKDIYDEVPCLSFVLSYQFYTINETKELSLEFIFDEKYFSNISNFEYKNNNENDFFNKLYEEKFIKQVIDKNLYCIKIFINEEVVL